MAKKITFEYGAMSSRFRLQTEDKFTAYATMVLQFYRNPQLVALYEPADLAKQDSWLMHNPVEQRLDEIFGDKVCGVVVDAIPNFDWFDTDTTYKEDVLAFISAFLEAAKDITYI